MLSNSAFTDLGRMSTAIFGLRTGNDFFSTGFIEPFGYVDCLDPVNPSRYSSDLISLERVTFLLGGPLREKAAQIDRETDMLTSAVNLLRDMKYLGLLQEAIRPEPIKISGQPGNKGASESASSPGASMSQPHQANEPLEPVVGDNPMTWSPGDAFVHTSAPSSGHVEASYSVMPV